MKPFELLNFIVSLISLIVTILVKREKLANAFKELRNQFKQHQSQRIAKKVITKFGTSQSSDNIQPRQVDSDGKECKLLKSRSAILSSLILSLTFTIGIIMALFISSIAIRSLVNILAPGGYIALFWILIIAFALIGFEQGLARELVVIFSSILALVINDWITRYFLSTLHQNSSDLFWWRTLTLIAVVYTLYVAVTKASWARYKAYRETLQEGLLGMYLGAISGYLIWGTLWYYLHMSDYSIYGVNPPNFYSDEIIQRMIKYMPPSLLTGGNLYASFFIVLILMIIVYI